MYSEGYSYDGTTGNLASKNGVNYTAYDANHKHAVTNLSNGNSYGYDDNGNMTSRNVGGQSFTLAYDAENRLVSVSGAATASFVYDGDSKQVKATVNGTTTYYIGNHYEVKSGVVTKYYFAGATRIAVRTGGTLSYLLGDHLGSSSVTTDANGVQTASALYKAFGETRYTLGNLGTDYQFTGQRLQAELGIYWFQSRWMDPSLGRFTQPDTIVPTSTQGTQAWDRYAFVNNNPVRYNDPTGHGVDCGVGGNEPCPDDPPADTDCPSSINPGYSTACDADGTVKAILMPASSEPINGYYPSPYSQQYTFYLNPEETSGLFTILQNDCPGCEGYNEFVLGSQNPMEDGVSEMASQFIKEVPFLDKIIGNFSLSTDLTQKAFGMELRGVAYNTESSQWGPSSITAVTKISGGTATALQIHGSAQSSIVRSWQSVSIMQYIFYAINNN